MRLGRPLEGSIEWLSFPRFDSPSVFGRLLGPDAGHWRIAPTDEWRSTRRYVDRTLVLETTFTTPTGVLVLTDLLALGPDNGGHRLGLGVPRLSTSARLRPVWITRPRVRPAATIYVTRDAQVGSLRVELDGRCHCGGLALLVGSAPGVRRALA